MNAAANARTRELTLTRIFDAPRDLVFRAWTDPLMLAQWWGPRMFTAPLCEVDPRVGGEIKIVMRGPDGAEHTMKGVFREIVCPEKIVFVNNAYGADGTQHLEGITTVIFAGDGGKTKLTLYTIATGLTPMSEMMLGGMNEGWVQTIDRLGEFVAGAK
jgi:uncharacterized protein YndB with AHSA1/START domain